MSRKTAGRVGTSTSGVMNVFVLESPRQASLNKHSLIAGLCGVRLCTGLTRDYFDPL